MWRSGIRTAGLGVLLLVVVVVGWAAWTLVQAHRQMAVIAPPLPSRGELLAVAPGPDRPVSLRVMNTASQAMPRSAVLDPEQDPFPNAPYVMSHPSFALRWADGRILLVDAGMDREGAERFGKPLEWMAGAEPMRPLAPAAEQLGDAAERVDGIVFTHLHEDHVGGVTELCRGRTRPLRVFMTEAQDEHPNHTTRGARELLADVRRGGQGPDDPTCIEVVRIGSGGLQPLPGFDGAFVIHAGGHTPGSQIVVAHLEGPQGPRSWLFTGDIVNHVAGVLGDVPKPFLYRLLVVPENEERQAELRAFLRDLRDAGGVALLVSHDRGQLAESGVPGEL